jgi:hypothetical protein
MASVITHLVIGERVFDQIEWFSSDDYGSYLLGCLLVDVHFCSRVNRETTHFAKRLGGNGQRSFDKSCENFIAALDGLLHQPWHKLSSSEQAFVAGYYCHLATDEEWKRFDWETINQLGIKWWQDLNVPVTVILTVSAALRDVRIPQVLNHIPCDVFEASWEIMAILALEGGKTAAYCELLRRLGKSEKDIERAQHQHEVYWDDAKALIEDFFGGVEHRIDAMTSHVFKQMPMLSMKVNAT